MLNFGEGIKNKTFVNRLKSIASPIFLHLLPSPLPQVAVLHYEGAGNSLPSLIEKVTWDATKREGFVSEGFVRKRLVPDYFGIHPGFVKDSYGICTGFVLY